MKFKLLYLIVFLSMPVFSQESRFFIDQEDVNNFQLRCHAFVKKNKATFIFFNELSGSNIAWNKINKSINDLEYSWLVFIENDSLKFDFGFYYFKTVDKVKEGSIEQLLKSGQKAIYIESGASRELVSLSPSREPEIELSENNIKVVINNEQMFKLLFGNKPEIAHFWAIGTTILPRKCRAKILYE